MADYTEILRNLSNDPLEAAEQVSEAYYDITHKAFQSGRYFDLEYEQDLYDVFALSLEYIVPCGIEVDIPDMIDSIESNAATIDYFFGNFHKAVRGKTTLRKFSKARSKASIITTGVLFSESEMVQIQNKINDLRQAVSVARYLTADHKRRLMTRLEKLQAEFHKYTSDFDRFLGLILDVSTVARQVGEDAKPLVDRTREIAEIAEGAHRRREGDKLPSAIKKLLS